MSQVFVNIVFLSCFLAGPFASALSLRLATLEEISQGVKKSNPLMEQKIDRSMSELSFYRYVGRLENFYHVKLQNQTLVDLHRTGSWNDLAQAFYEKSPKVTIDSMPIFYPIEVSRKCAIVRDPLFNERY